jgi:hypothetical protein
VARKGASTSERDSPGLAVPDQHSAAGKRCTGTKPHERRPPGPVGHEQPAGLKRRRPAATGGRFAGRRPDHSGTRKAKVARRQDEATRERSEPAQAMRQEDGKTCVAPTNAPPEVVCGQANVPAAIDGVIEFATAANRRRHGTCLLFGTDRTSCVRRKPYVNL